MTRQAHQPRNVVNRNRRLTQRGGGAKAKPTEPEVAVSDPTNLDLTPYELDGHLTLVQEREIEWKVPVLQTEVDIDNSGIQNMVNQVGPLHELEVPIVTNNDPTSYYSAVNKRSNFIQDGPKDDLTDEMFHLALKIIRELPNFQNTTSSRWEENETDRERWLNKFSPSKQARMQQAWAEEGQASLKDLRKKTGSVKREVLLGKRYDKTAAGRIIYAGTDVFNAVTGPAMMVAMERLVELLATTLPDGKKVRLGEVEFMLGYKAQDTELADFIDDHRYPEIVEGDFSRNDREQRSRVALLCDAWFEKMGLPKWFRQLTMDLDTYTLVNYDFGLKVMLSYQLATGTTNTTFRNSIYNMTMFAVSCRRQKRKGKALVLGDDLLACLDHRLDLKRWVKDVGDFKMVLKAKAPALDGFATFLSRRFIMGALRPCTIPCPEKAYFRFNCRANANQAMSDDQYVCSKALSYAYGFRHCHLMRNIFLERFTMNGSHMDFDIEEIGWNNRQFGFTVADIYAAATGSQNLVADDVLAEWTYTVYQLDLVEFESLFREMILSNELIIIDNPLAAVFAEMVQ